MRSCDIGCGHCSLPNLLIFFFKQKTADEMRISDWSSDVCSSDLAESPYQNAKEYIAAAKADAGQFVMAGTGSKQEDQIITVGLEQATGDRKSVVSGKSVAVRLDLGGRRITKNKN